MKKFLSSRTNELLPFLLSLTISSAVYSVYSIPVLSIWTVGVFLMTAVFFLFCRFINKHHLLGGVLYGVTVVVFLYIFMCLVFVFDWGYGFQQWFLTGAEDTDTKFEYLLALMVSFVPFFASVIYYFGCVLYRMSFLTLISLIPCALYVKVLSEIDNVYVAIIAMLNVAILMTNIRSEKDKDRVVIGKTASIMAASVFTFVLLVFSALIPKENEARYYDRFEQLFMDSTGRRPMGDYTRFTDLSGNADQYRNFTNRYFYMLYGDKVPYFKRQNFDYYDYEQDRWYGEAYYSEPVYSLEEWQETHAKLSLSELQRAVIAAEGYSHGFAEKYGLTRICASEQINDPICSVTVEPQHFAAMYYLSPSRAVTVIPENRKEQVVVTRSGVIRNRERPHGESMGYNVMYHDETLSRFMWFELGGADFDNDSCEEMLSELAEILEENGDELSVSARAFYDEHMSAMDYRSEEYFKNTDMASDELKALAHQITDGYTYDWEKADALQRYFILNDYTYDMRFIAPDTSPEYFLFKSKRGSCSDYASAYVLMARAVGLTVRYTEGFNPDITSRKGVFSIKDSCAHAYPEVYIQNMGWIVFEPTVPSDYSQLVSDGDNNVQLSIDYDLVFVICVISAIILSAALAVVILAPVISEKRFINKLDRASADESVILVYKRISARTAAKIVKRTDTLTPFELMDKLESLTGCDTEGFAYAAERVLYGQTAADEKDRQLAKDCYEKVRTAVKEYRKEENRRKRVSSGKAK